MKQPVNFRLSEEAICAMDHLAKTRGISRTRVVEEAIRHLAENGAARRRPFEGISEEDADLMLEAINAPVPPSDDPPLFP